MDLPCGTRNFSYAQDMAIFRTKTQWTMLLLLLAFIFTAPLYLGNYWLSVASTIGITVVAVTGLNLLLGYCGQLSVGHAGFIAVGAYTTAILAGDHNVPFLVALLCAGIVSGLVGMVFGLPSLKVKGFYLAITTIAAQMIIIWVINHWDPVTHGGQGMRVPAATIGGITFNTQAELFFLIMAIAVIVTFFAVNLARTRVGRAFVAIRDNDLAAEVMGVNLFTYKLLAFFVGCFLAGIAGGLFAHQIRFINGELFTLADSILYVGMVIIGGLGTSIGPIFGAVFIVLLKQLVLFLTPLLESIFSGRASGATAGLETVVFGLVIVLFLVFEPRGLAHRWRLFKAAYRLWPFSY